MGLDWRWLSLSAYLEALEAHNESTDPQGGKQPASANLKKFMKAHGLGDGGHRATRRTSPPPQ
jgi:hypothetical protein